MDKIISIKKPERNLIDKIVFLHICTFKGFFLSSLHPGFLRQLYKAFVKHQKSDLLVYFRDDEPLGFLAYSWDTSGVYRYMLRRYFFQFVWYSFLSFLKKPAIFIKLLSALSMPSASKRDADYVKIFSIGVDPAHLENGIGSRMIDELKEQVDFDKYQYITLETDADNNEKANRFYRKNGFRLSSDFYTFEGRHMNKYHFRKPHESPVS